jgi:hypothetical protein
MATLETNTVAVLLELNRELDTRKRVYPEWVRKNKIKRDVADHRIKLIEQAIKIVMSTIPTQTSLPL